MLVLNSDPNISDRDADAYLGKPPGTCRRFRAIMNSPKRSKECKYIELLKLLVPTRIGRNVFYRKSVLDNFLDACKG